MSDWDLVVSGGGPVGLVTAMAARRLGLSALVLEQSQSLPIKACGEGLMPRAVEVLERLGVSLAAAREFRGIRFVDADAVAHAEFAGTRGRALRRYALMQLLDRRARELGVEVLAGHTVRDFSHAHGRVSVQVSSQNSGVLRCMGRLLVGADGLRSPTRRKLGFELPPQGTERFGNQRHFRCAPWSDWVEVYWHDRAEAYVTPLAHDRVGVAILSHGRPLPAEDWRRLFPALLERLGNAPGERVRGAGPLEQRVQSVLAPGVALVGDAAGYLDAISGEGLALGFCCALALVRRFATGELWRYPQDHRRLSAGYYRTTRLLLELARRPRSRRLAMRLLSRHPALCSKLLSWSAGPPTLATAALAELDPDPRAAHARACT